MKFEIVGKNYAVSEGLQNITEKKCSKLDKYFEDDKGAVAKFSIEYEGSIYTTELKVSFRSLVYRASATSENPYDNLDLVIPKLIGQVRKQKDIWAKNKKGVENTYEEE